MRNLMLAALVAASPLIAADQPEAITPTKTIVLFNGSNLDGWKIVGKDNDPKALETWVASGGVIRCSGFPSGYLRTEKTYRNYKLTVEWRWDTSIPLKPHANGKPRVRNNGVLLHIQGEDVVWPSSLEAQLMENYAGDFFIIGKVTTAEHLTARERDIAAAQAANDEKALKKAQGNRRMIRRVESSEKPLGEWNRYEIICQDGTVTLYVNGVEQNRVTQVSQSSGYIAVQSEGAPIEFRNIKIEPLPSR